MTVDEVKDLLRSIMIHDTRLESGVVGKIEKVLREHHIEYKREAKIGPRCRVDLLLEGGIAVEVKRGRPNVDKVIRQVERYMDSDLVESLLLVTEKGVWIDSGDVNGKKFEYLALSQNWGLTV